MPAAAAAAARCLSVKLQQRITLSTTCIVHAALTVITWVTQVPMTSEQQTRPSYSPVTVTTAPVSYIYIST